MVEEKAISVTQISTYFKQIFDAEELLQNISVFGEVSDFSISRGIAYFSLKDENALLSCVCFDGANLQSVRNGDMVIVRGSPRYYVKGGRLNFNVNKITPYGMGNLFEQFLKLKQTLEDEGLFDSKHKKIIDPKSIKRIGVVTSETGAVIQDIINIVKRRNPNVDIVLYPVKVQGAMAELSIVKGINFFSDYDGVDVMIVARGGGSLEDLQPFNTEVVARAVFAANKPVVSAVGHETDFTIIDFVSDLRAPTPSAAAELVTEDVLSKRYNLIDKISRLSRAASNLYNGLKIKFVHNLKLLYNAQESFLNEREYMLSLKTAKLSKLNPKEIMRLGYAKVSKGDKVITSVEETSVGEHLLVTLADGSIDVVRR